MNETANKVLPKHIEVAQSIAREIIENYALDLQSEMINEIIIIVSNHLKNQLEAAEKGYEYSKISLKKLDNYLHPINPVA